MPIAAAVGGGAERLHGPCATSGHEAAAPGEERREHCRGGCACRNGTWREARAGRQSVTNQLFACSAGVQTAITALRLGYNVDTCCARQSLLSGADPSVF